MGTKLAGKFKKFCEAEGKQIYTALRKMNSAFAERTILSSKKNFVLWRTINVAFLKWLKLCTPLFKRDAITSKAISQSKCLKGATRYLPFKYRISRYIL